MERAFAARRVKARRSSAPATGSAAMRLAESSETIRQRASAPRTAPAAPAAFPARIASASRRIRKEPPTCALRQARDRKQLRRRTAPALRPRRQDAKRSQERPARRRSVIRPAAGRRAAACIAPLRPSTRSDRPAPLPSWRRRPRSRWRDSESRTATAARSAVAPRTRAVDNAARKTAPSESGAPLPKRRTKEAKAPFPMERLEKVEGSAVMDLKKNFHIVPQCRRGEPKTRLKVPAIRQSRKFRYNIPKNCLINYRIE